MGQPVDTAGEAEGGGWGEEHGTDTLPHVKQSQWGLAV